MVKRNQPGLHAQLAALPRRDVPVAYTKRERGHGRTERRTLKVTAVARGLAFPHAAQAIQITRRRKVNGKWSRESCYAVTSLTVTQASPARLAAIIRGHWGIEDRLHWVRDLDFDEDRSQIRTASGPRIMASLRNLAVTILRLAGARNIAAALRYQARRSSRPSLDDHEVLTGFTGQWMAPYLVSRTRSTSSVRVSLGISALCICSIRQAENVPRMTFSLMSLRTPAARSDARSRSLPPGRRTRRSSAA